MTQEQLRKILGSDMRARARLHQVGLLKQADAYLIASTEVRSFRLKEFLWAILELFVVGERGKLHCSSLKIKQLRDILAFAPT